MNKVYIFEADPTRFGEIRKSCLTPTDFFREKSVLLARCGALDRVRTTVPPFLLLDKGKMKSCLRHMTRLRAKPLPPVPGSRKNPAYRLQGGDVIVLNADRFDLRTVSQALQAVTL